MTTKQLGQLFALVNEAIKEGLLFTVRSDPGETGGRSEDVKSICLNGDCIQLNLESFQKELDK